MRIIDSAKDYCKEEHDAEMMEERTLARAMRQKLMLRKMQERRARFGTSETP